MPLENLDPRDRAIAHLNEALRSGNVEKYGGGALERELLSHGVELIDLDRNALANHLLRALEQEFPEIRRLFQA